MLSGHIKMQQRQHTNKTKQNQRKQKGTKSIKQNTGTQEHLPLENLCSMIMNSTSFQRQLDAFGRFTTDADWDMSLKEFWT